MFAKRYFVSILVILVLFEDKKILITGGTGSLGKALTKRLLDSGANSVRVFSRNENKQIEMEREFEFDSRLRFLIGDVRDRDRLVRAVEGVDMVFHGAALKHVPVIEYNPFEGIQTNIIGSQNVIDACHIENVEFAVAVGTDKAVSPVNVYGATKLVMEKLFLTASNYVNKEKHTTKFFVARYGNVFGSSGSVVPAFIQRINSDKKITITNPDMTRFSITMNEALDFILNSVKEANGAETFVPKLKAYNIMDVKDAIFELMGKGELEITSIRPGEKMHESLISLTEMRYAIENEKKYIIFKPDEFIEQNKKYSQYKNIENVFEYSSDKAQKLSKSEIKEIIKNSKLLE